MRRGVTLPELLISLTVMSGVLALATHFALGQQRLFREQMGIADVRSQLNQGAQLVASIAWSVAPAGGELLAAHDTALEIRMVVGVAVACGGAPGRMLLPAPANDTGPTLAAFLTAPALGDHAAALFSDSLGDSWLTLRVAGPPTVGAGCAALPGIQESWTVPTLEPLAIPVGAPLRITRPLRLAFYRASDGRWYLGARDWNGADAAFNAVQPVAGPLRPWSSDPGETGLRFTYRDRAGALLSPPVDPASVASIAVVLRAASRRPVRLAGFAQEPVEWQDSAVTVITLRNAP